MNEKEDALTKTYDLMLWLFPQVGKFPKQYRFILGDRIENLLLDVCGGHQKLKSNLTPIRTIIKLPPDLQRIIKVIRT